MSQATPPPDGLLNLNRACRYAWNFGTFLEGQSGSGNVWSYESLCLTFKKEDLNKLVSDHEESAGIRFYVGLAENAPDDKRYLQLFAVGCRNHELYSTDPHHQMTYDDVAGTNNVGIDGNIYGYNIASSSSARNTSPVNPAIHPVQSSPENGPRTPNPQYIQNTQTYHPGSGTVVSQAEMRAAVQNFYDASRGGLGSPLIQNMTATTVHDPSLGTSPNDTEQFEIKPADWPWAFFFHKTALLDIFGNEGEFDKDIRIYFGITDVIDTNTTGATPGMLKLFLVGVDIANNDELFFDIEVNNKILDFSSPCPQYCGSVTSRIWSPPTA